VIEYGLVTHLLTIEFDSVKSGGCPLPSDSRVSSLPCFHTVIAHVRVIQGRQDLAINDNHIL